MPTPQQQAFATQPHLPATPAQQQHEQVAKQDKADFASVNHGVPVHAAFARSAASVAGCNIAPCLPRPPGGKATVSHSGCSSKARNAAYSPIQAGEPGNKTTAVPAHSAPNAYPTAAARPAAKPASAPAKPATETRAAQPTEKNHLQKTILKIRSERVAGQPINLEAIDHIAGILAITPASIHVSKGVVGFTSPPV